LLGFGAVSQAITTSGRKARSSWPRFLTSQQPFPWLAPITAMLVVFVVYPLVYTFWLARQKRNPVTRLSIVDLTWNWSKIFSDERVWGAIGRTFAYTISALAIEMMLGPLIASLLDSGRRGCRVLRALMTGPLVLPPAIAGMMFLLMLVGSFGALSRALDAAGLWSREHLLLATSSTRLPATRLADLRQWMPFMILILLGGLRTLPKDPYEAAASDGASSLQAFFKLTLPMLSKVIAIAALIRGVDLFGIHDDVKVKTDSGPGASTKTDTLSAEVSASLKDCHPGRAFCIAAAT
jgi:multiple sugar transport system permease protein